MTKENAVRALSNNELETVSGGQVVVCTQDWAVTLFGFTFHASTCDDGSRWGYVTWKGGAGQPFPL